MSFPLMRQEILSQLVPPHTDPSKQARVIAQAYTNCVLRHFEKMSGGGTAVQAPARTPALLAGLQQIFNTNRQTGFNKLNFWQQLNPLIIQYWTGQIFVGPIGIVAVTFPGILQGPPIPENLDYNLWLNMLSSVLAAHFQSLTGIFTNFFPGISFPWLGVFLSPCPVAGIVPGMPPAPLPPLPPLPTGLPPVPPISTGDLLSGAVPPLPPLPSQYAPFPPEVQYPTAPPITPPSLPAGMPAVPISSVPPPPNFPAPPLPPSPVTPNFPPVPSPDDAFRDIELIEFP